MSPQATWLQAESISRPRLSPEEFLYLNPTPLATMVPVTPEDRTCVVLTGKPKTAAKPIVVIATNSEEAPCA